jgi:hypothetical protein
MLGSKEAWTTLGHLACCRSLGPIRGRILLDGFVLSFATIMRILKGEVRHVLVGFGQLEHLQARLRQHHILCLRARFLGTVQEPRNMENGSSGSLIHCGPQTSESVLWFHFGASEQSQQTFQPIECDRKRAPGLQGKPQGSRAPPRRCVLHSHRPGLLR